VHRTDQRPRSDPRPLSLWDRLRPLLRRIPGAVAAHVALRHIATLAVSPGYREAQRLGRTGRAGLFQPENTTRPNRYPEIFAWLRETLAADPTPRILSFGCSTGEEIVTLKSYLPQAHITGIDINRGNLIEAAAKTRGFGDSVRLIEASSLADEPPDYYDAILCLTVLLNRKLRLEQLTDSSAILPFAQFEAAVTDIARCVKPGGYLVIYGTNFDFGDTAIAAQFAPSAFQPKPEETPAPAFSRENRLIPGRTHDEAIYQRRG